MKNQLKKFQTEKLESNKDKMQQNKKSQWRVPESVLVGYSLIQNILRGTDGSKILVIWFISSEFLKQMALANVFKLSAHHMYSRIAQGTKLPDSIRLL